VIAMSRTRRIIASTFRGGLWGKLRADRAQDSNEGGFSLIEVMVALALVITVMATTAGFFTTSLKQSNGQTQAQEAAVLADQQLDYTRSVAATSLLSGRTQTAVQAAIASPGSVDLSQDVTATGNYDPSATGASSQAVPISMTNNVGGTTYTIVTFINQCYVAVAANQTCTATDSGNGWVYRITVDVSYQVGGGRSCGAANKPCQFVVSTLRDPGTDPCFNVNVAYAGCSTSQPTITSISPTTVTTNTSTTVTLTGTNFDPGATVSLDTGGSVTNVTRISSTSVSFTLVTDNTVAAVGTRTVKLTNPNGKFAYGTMTITTSAMSANTVTPSPINTGTTTTLTIAGSGFQSGSVVTIPTTAGTIVGSPTITANTITLSFTAGSGASAIGTWAATVTNPDGATDTANFVVQKAPVTLTTINPSPLLWGATRTFTLTGTGFNSGAQVTLDGANVTEAWNSATSMTVTLTSDPSVATHTFAVTNPDGGTASKTFTVNVNPMTVTSVTPSVTLSGSTKNFTITGTGFNSAAQVTFDGAATSEVWVSSTSMTVALASFPAIGSHTFAVTNPDGGSGSVTFMVAKAHISSMSPITIAHGTQVTVTITGTNFVTSGAVTPTVTVNGATTGVTTVTIVSATSVTFKYTISSTKATYTYPVQVTSKDGTVSDVFSWVVTSS
jgi:prepilin-type N-terminal cleavage/methylation domain-containing protein